MDLKAHFNFLFYLYIPLVQKNPLFMKKDGELSWHFHVSGTFLIERLINWDDWQSLEEINDASFGVSKDFAGLWPNNASYQRQQGFVSVQVTNRECCSIIRTTVCRQSIAEPDQLCFNKYEYFFDCQNFVGLICILNLIYYITINFDKSKLSIINCTSLHIHVDKEPNAISNHYQQNYAVVF